MSAKQHCCIQWKICTGSEEFLPVLPVLLFEMCCCLVIFYERMMHSNVSMHWASMMKAMWWLLLPWRSTGKAATMIDYNLWGTTCLCVQCTHLSTLFLPYAGKIFSMYIGKTEDKYTFHILKWYYKHAGKILSGMPLYLVIFLLWLITVRKLKIRDICMYGLVT